MCRFCVLNTREIMPYDGREWEQGLFVHQVLAWAKQHQQRLASALAGLIAKQELLEALLAWLQWAETTLSDRDKEVIPQEIEEVKALIAEHQVTYVTPARLLGPSQKAMLPISLPQPPPRPWSFSRFAGVSSPFWMLLLLAPSGRPPRMGSPYRPPPAPSAGSSPRVLSPGPPLPPAPPWPPHLFCSLVHVCIFCCLLSASHRKPASPSDTSHLNGNIRSHSKKFQVRR